MGTLFLDEIGEMPLTLQARLLRILQEREVMRIGGDSVIKVDVRIIAATNRDLKELVNKGLFRRDLYFRLNVLPLKLPALRERSEDIPILIEDIKGGFVADFELTSEAEKAFCQHNWDGNIRELRNYIEYLTNLNLKEVDIKDLPFDSKTSCGIESMDEQQLQIFERFMNYIEHDSLKYEFVLEQLDIAYTNMKKVGRRSIVKVALDNNIYLTEQEVRRVLLELEGFKLVAISTGRGGTKITQLGKMVIERMKKG
jgi:transcriptional regulator with PAS, ATPase and Fis domain